MLNDLRYALRLIGRNRVFAATVIFTLAIAIGFSTSVFSVVDGVLFRPLPYTQPSTLVTMRSASPRLFQEWKQRTTALGALAAFDVGHAPLLLAGDEASRLRQAVVTVDLFSVLGVPMAIGRDFVPEDARSGAEPVVILTHSAWRQRFSGRADVIGLIAPFEPVKRRVVGVLPADFMFPMRVIPALGDMRIFTPMAEPAPRSASLTLVGRLNPHVTVAQARGEELVVRQASTPSASRPKEPTLAPLSEEILGNSRTALMLLLGAAGCLLLISCANVGNLFFARGIDRSRELALRLALGARRAQLVRLVIVESCVLSGVGGMIGMLMAQWSFDALRAILPAQLPRAGAIAIDGRVLVFAFLISVVAGLALGVVPAWRLSRVPLRGALAGQGQSGTSSGQYLRLAVVAAEVALAVVLLAGAALFTNSFVRLLRADIGFMPDKVLTLEMRPPEALYPTPEDQRRFLGAAIERLASLPGIESVGAVDLLPVTRARAGGSVAAIDGDTTDAVEPRIVSPGYLATMGVPLLLGRSITWNDSSTGPPIAVINQALARRLWPGREPIGRRLRLGSEPPREVVGVVGDVRGFAVDTAAEAQMYVPYAQWPWVPPRLVVRTIGPPEAFASTIRSELRALEPRVPVENVRPLAAFVAASIAQPRFLTFLLGLFGACGFLLSAIGIAGVVAYGVSQRTREIGIRVALGARSSDVRRTVIGPSLAATAVGLAAGLAATLVLTRFARSFLYEVRPNDPMTLSVVLLLLGATAVAAAWLPARRATRVDPVVALRA